jgi:glycosyltransferase involved in cell wall biosynthesis
MGKRPWRRANGQHWGLWWADRIIANSWAGLQAWKIGSDKGRVVYNGYDPERTPTLVQDGASSRTPFTVVMTGRMVKEKDYRLFFAAARTLMEEPGQEWCFLAIGDGPDRITLLNETRNLVQRGVASFPDPGLEVIGLISQAQVGVLLSHPVLHAEGCSNSVMEYMMCGLPVVCSDSGGNPELVVAGETGFLIPPGDLQALVDRLVFLRQHAAEARRMGCRGQQRVVHHFSVEAMVQGMVKVYNEVV